MHASLPDRRSHRRSGPSQPPHPSKHMSHDPLSNLAPRHRRRASDSSAVNEFRAQQSNRVNPQTHLIPHSSSLAQSHRTCTKRPHSPTQSPRVSLSDFRLTKVLGSGGTATVIRAEPLPSRPAATIVPVSELAIKAVPKKRLSRRAAHYLGREIAVHRNLTANNHILSLYHVFEDSDAVYLAVELLRGSDLYTALRKEGHGFSEYMALSIIAQVLNALVYMHERGYAHRDIKPENIMFVEKPALSSGKVPAVKLIDFGLACARDPNAPPKQRMSSEKCGTVRYAAPEIVTDAAYMPDMVDIWSVGIVLYSTIAHRNPYSGKTEREVLDQIRHTPLTFNSREWMDVSEDTRNLIARCLSRRPADRPTAAVALQEVRRILSGLKASSSDCSLMSEDGDLMTGVTPEFRETDGFGISVGNSSTQTKSEREVVEMRRSNHDGETRITRELRKHPPDMSGFSSNVTPERPSSNGHSQREAPRRRRAASLPNGSVPTPERVRSVDEERSHTPNFFDGLRAFFAWTALPASNTPNSDEASNSPNRDEAAN